MISYIPKLSKEIQNIGSKFNIKSVFKRKNTSNSILTEIKNPNDKQNSKETQFQIHNRKRFP